MPVPEHRVRCFTLVEIIVAMAIMMLVAMILGSAGATFYQGYERSVKAASRLKRNMAIDRIWDNEIRNMVPFKWLDADNQSRLVFAGDSDHLLFTALRRCHGNDPGALVFVKLEVIDEHLVATTSFYPLLPWEENDSDGQFDDSRQDIIREVIAEDVRAISFRYAEQSTGNDTNPIEWLDYWDEDDHPSLPLAVQMTVEFTDDSSEVWLRRVAGSACGSTFGNRDLPSQASSSGGSR